MKKKKKVIILFVIVFVLVGVITTVFLIFLGYRDSEVTGTYKIDKDSVDFYIEYSNSCYQGFYINNSNAAVVIEDKDKRQENSNIFSRLGIIKTRKIISFKARGKGIAEINFILPERYIDGSCYKHYKVQVTDTEIIVNEVLRP